MSPAWTIPTDATTARNPTIKISFDKTKLYSPYCDTALNDAHFTNIALTGGDASNPVVVITKNLNEVPLCA